MQDSGGESPSQHGTWKQSIASLFISVALLLAFRWIVFEPYVIPSGSMIPTLRVLDFIYVNKFAYGLRLPFSSTWLFDRALPKRCDIVVFRSQTEPGVFLVKRVMGLPGEKVELFESGRVRINDRLLSTEKIAAPRGDGDAAELERYTRLSESCSPENGETRKHRIQLLSSLADIETDPVIYAVTVPENHLVMFGDNRHESADSRVWGTLPRTELLGQALGIWLSCEKAMPGLSRLCDPSSLRFQRIFTGLEWKGAP